MAGVLTAWVFDECDATGQQRISAVLFSRAFSPGLAASAWASDCICASGCLISANRKGANGWPQLSADSSIVWGQLVGAAFVCLGLPPHPPGSSEYYRRLLLGNTAVPPQLGPVLTFPYLKLLAALDSWSCMFLGKKHILRICILNTNYLSCCEFWSELHDNYGLLCLTLQGLVVLVLTLLPCMVTVWLANVQKPNSLEATDCGSVSFFLSL